MAVLVLLENGITEVISEAETWQIDLHGRLSCIKFHVDPQSGKTRFSQEGLAEYAFMAEFNSGKWLGVKKI